MTFQNALCSMYIKHDLAMQPLSTQALSQLALKIIYFKRSLKFEELRNEISKIIETNLKDTDLQKALDSLKKDHKVDFLKNQIKIKDSYVTVLDSSLSENEERHKRIIEKWFSGTETDQIRIRKWFEEVTILFFQNFQYDWIKELCGGKSKSKQEFQNLNKIIEESFKSNKIQNADKKWLLNQYREFLESEDVDTKDVLWGYSTSMFTATLIKAGISADHYTTEIFKNSTFILDTNILLLLNLDSKTYRESFRALEKMFSKYKISLGYFHITLEEYKKVMQYMRTICYDLFRKYPRKVFEKMEDFFVKTIMLKDFVSFSALKEFFSNTENPPNKFFEELPIIPIESIELEKKITDGMHDLKLQATLNSIQLQRRKESKRQSANEHDAGIIRGVEYLKTKGNYWLLTKDGTVSRYAIRFPKRDEYPIAVSLSVLINLMAYLTPESTDDHHDLANLFNHIIKYSLQPETGSYEREDLSFMLTTNIKISDIPVDTQIEYLKKINKKRLEGVPNQDLDLFVRRLFEKDRLEHATENENLKIDLSLSKQRILEKTHENENISDGLKIELKRKILKTINISFYTSLLFYLVGLPILIFVLITLIAFFWDDDIFSQIIQKTIITLIVQCIIAYKQLPKIYRAKSEKLKNLHEDVENLLVKIKEGKNNTV